MGGENITKLLRKKKELVDKIGARISENNRSGNSPEMPPKESPRELRREDITGKWKVMEHTVGNEEYLSRFFLQKFKGAEWKNGIYEAFYEFKERVCLKSICITGDVVLEGTEYPYRHKVKLTSTYSVAGGKLSVVLESGYLYYQLGDQSTVVKNFESDDRELQIDLRISGMEMVLEEKDERDFKRLKKMVK